MIILFSFFLCENNNMYKLPLITTCDFEEGKAKDWQPNIPEHWRVVEHEDSIVYDHVAPGEQGQIRAPTSWSVLTGYDVTSFVVTGRFKCKKNMSVKARDLCVFFHQQDPTHFYYVHFSAMSDGVHNIIALVNGAYRVKINVEVPGQSVARLTEMEWHKLKVTYDESTCDIQAFPRQHGHIYSHSLRHDIGLWTCRGWFIR